MNKHLGCHIFIGLLIATAQVDHAYAENFSDDYNKQSSSFVVEPDPLDPLPAKQENIKDGDEIILDDIKQVLNSKIEKSKSENGSTNNGEAGEITSSVSEGSGENSSTSSKSKSRKKKVSKKSSQSRNLSPDDADIRLENKFHNIYQTYNINPTSSEQWGVATSTQTMNVYTVQKNDTLFTISQTLFGDSKFWPKIWALNKSSILNPHQIRPGMEIYFYSGNAETPPVLSLDKSNTEQVNPDGQIMASAGDPEDGSEDAAKEDKEKYYVQNTEFNKSLNAQLDAKRKFSDPTPIPDSLPLTKNGNYFGQKKEEKLDIQLQTFNYVDPENYKNPYIVSADKLKGDFKLPESDAAQTACVDNQFIPIVNRKNANAAIPGNYLMVDALDSDKSKIRSTYKYKVIGSVTINDNNQMRVSHCDQLYNTDILLVSQEAVSALNEPNEQFSFTASVLDGLDYDNQEFYSTNQYMIINLEGLNVDTGANLKVYSDSLGKQVGNIKIIKRSGTIAIAIVTHANDIISRGDRITE